MRPKPSSRDSRSSIKDKRVITKDGTEVVRESTSPGAPNDEPSTAVEVQYPTEAKNATSEDD
jgi:hypothetical protein